MSSFSANALLRRCVILLALVCLVSAWHPEKKVMKWSPTFFRAAGANRMCASVGSPCGGSTQKHYGLYWRSTSCCYGLDCQDAGHGSFCAEPDTLQELVDDEAMEGGNVLTVPEDPEDASSVLIPSME